MSEPAVSSDGGEATPILRPEVATLQHHDTCPGIRGRECMCAANLKLVRDGTYAALEKKTNEWVEATRMLVDGEVRSGLKPVMAELWRVDDGRSEFLMRPNPMSHRAPAIRVETRLDPRWVCTRCGWASRGTALSHRCDPSAVALSVRTLTLASGLSKERIHSGDLRVAFWRDVDGLYHVVEELIENGKVVKTVERDSDGAYGVVEGALLSAAVDIWS